MMSYLGMAWHGIIVVPVVHFHRILCIAQAIASKKLTIEEKVTQFYGSCRPERRGIFTEMDARHLFFIEGDALVMETLANSTLELATGGQTLNVWVIGFGLQRSIFL